MRFTANFRDSDLARFLHETDRRPSVDAVRVNADRDEAMQLLRSPPNPRDRSLSSLAQAWRDRLPPEQRPLQLCDRYPRVANRLALCWGDPVLTEMLFKDLLNDRRGMRLRKGFPPPVLRELLALHDLARRQSKQSA